MCVPVPMTRLESKVAKGTGRSMLCYEGTARSERPPTMVSQSQLPLQVKPVVLRR